MTDVLLEARNIRKWFGGVHALDDVSFAVPSHCIYGIIGPNGAGKTSLFNVMTGLHHADAGELFLRGSNIINQPPHKIVQQGIARTFQNIRLFKSMTVLENVMVGRHAHSLAGVFGAIVRSYTTRNEEESIREKAQHFLDYVGLKDASSRLACELSYGDQRRLEIARAMATDPKLLALDEPAAGMNPSETATLINLLMRLRDDGITVLLIEHDVRLIMTVCNHMAVLDYGEKIAEGSPTEIQNDPKVIEAYLGLPL